MRRLVFTALIVVVMSRAAWGIGGLGDIVHDPPTFLQTSIIAARSLQSNVNEAIQLKQQAEQLLGQAKQLMSLPVSYIAQVEAELQRYYNLLNEGRAMVYRAQGVARQFEDLYGAVAHGQGNVFQRAQAILAQIKQASRVSMEAQAIYDRLLAQKTTTQRLVTASQGAVGELQAAQATNQLLAVLSDQQASLQQLHATLGRVQVSAVMQEMVANEQAQRNAQQFMEGYRDNVFRGPKQGQGFALPR
jgi:P-type conjugative transfer protein TrbJ